MKDFQSALALVKQDYNKLIERKNTVLDQYNGIYSRYKYPILTANHAPYFWKYDLNPQTNPLLVQRFGINAAFNAGALKFEGKYILAVRVEGWDRKSFFAIAESPNAIDNFQFWDEPVQLPENNDPDINVYDMRLTKHEDGWIYGIFCTERKDPNAPEGDTSSAIANAGIVRTKDLKNWERLPDLISNTGQQRNVVLHPEFVNGKYALYTRPQDGFIDVGGGGGIGFGFVTNMLNPVVENETIINEKKYHTIYELKNGLGPAPIKTDLLDLKNPQNIIGHISPILFPEMKYEKDAFVKNVVFSNGAIVHPITNELMVYYGAGDESIGLTINSIEEFMNSF